MKQVKGREVEGLCSLDSMVGKGFTNEVAFAEKPECSEGVKQENTFRVPQAEKYQVQRLSERPDLIGLDRLR